MTLNRKSGKTFEAAGAAEWFFGFVGENPEKLRALDLALADASRRTSAKGLVEVAASVMAFAAPAKTKASP